MKTNSVPYSDQPPGATPDTTRVGNIYGDDSTANGYDDGYAISGSTILSGSQNYLTDVGAYTSSPSYYGAFDMGGNVWEWNEASITSSNRGVRGGAWFNNSLILKAGYRDIGVRPSDDYELGFRVAAAELPGDFNADGRVDAADYVAWRIGFATGAYKQTDYNTWRANFGATAAGAAAVARSSLEAVPEPISPGLIAIALLLISSSTRLRR